MPADQGFSDVKQLYSLINQFRRGEISTLGFCDEFETLYNLKVDKSQLREVEAKAFAHLFEKVVWYSPFPGEQKKIPNYVDDGAIAQAVEAAVASLASKTSDTNTH